jgi:hypothetical protein
MSSVIVTTSFFPMPNIVRHRQPRSTAELTEHPEVTQW